MNSSHRRDSLGRVLRDGTYPFRTAISPFTLYCKARLGRANCDYGLAAALARTLETASHCYPRRSDLVWASVPRSGHNWVSNIYTMIVERHFFGQAVDLADVEKHRKRVYRHINIRYDLGDHEEPFHYDLPIPRLMHTHGPEEPWLRARRVMFQVRDPRDVAISFYFFRGASQEMELAEFVRSGALRHVFRCYNSWGAAMERREPSQCLLVRYEDVRRDPLSQMRAILTFFGIDSVTDQVIRDSVAACDIHKTRQVQSDRQASSDLTALRQGRSGKVGQAQELDDATRDLLETVIREQLRYDFGYFDRPSEAVVRRPAPAVGSAR